MYRNIPKSSHLPSVSIAKSPHTSLRKMLVALRPQFKEEAGGLADDNIFGSVLFIAI